MKKQSKFVHQSHRKGGIQMAVSDEVKRKRLLDKRAARIERQKETVALLQQRAELDLKIKALRAKK